MKQKTSFILTIILLSTILLHAQRTPLEIYTSGFNQGNINLWNYEKTTAAFYDPAESHFDKISFYSSFGKWTKSKIYEDTYINGHYIVPGFISIGIPINSLMISAGYYNYYNSRNYTTIQQSTIEEPLGTGNTINIEFGAKLHIIFNSVKYGLNNNLSIGIMFGLNILTEKFSKSNGSGYGYSFNTNIVWKPINTLKLGLNISSISNIDYVIKNELNRRIKIVEGDNDNNGNNEQIPASATDLKRRGFFPLSYGLKVGYAIQPDVKIDFRIERQEWDIANNADKSIFNVHFRSSYRIIEQIVLNIGYFTHNNPLLNYSAHNIEINKYKNLQYFSFGVDYQIFDSFVVNISVLDNNQISGNNYDLTYFSTSLLVEI
jgi:long-subunit fatty acid transport protein